MDTQKLREAEEALYNLLGPELTEITKFVTTKPGSENPYLIELPTAYTIDQTLEEIASIVARTANAFVRCARYAGMARAEYKLAKGRYDRKFKRARTGKNDAEREAAAMEICANEHTAMITAEAIAELADSYESAARIASESIRKIFDKAQAMQIGQAREEKGQYRDSDFSPY